MTKQEKNASDTIKQLQVLVDKMSKEERDRLLGLGVVVPQGDMTNALQNRFKFGVRCTDCNHVALYFVGEEWTMEDGTVVDVPPPLPHSQILWTQSLPPHQIDRSSPKCQHCGAVVPTEASGSFRRNRGRIVEIERFNESRDASFDRKRLSELRKEISTGGGATIEVASSYDATRETASQTITKQRGEGAVQELAFLAKATGVEEGLRTGFRNE